MRTASGGGGETEVPGTSPCATCTVSEIELVPGDDATLVTPTITTPTVGSDGCLVTTVTCDVTDMPGTVTFMNFNDNLGGPDSATVNLITAELVCSDEGWTYTADGVTNTITKVECLFGSSNSPRTCGTCDPTNIVFNPGVVFGTYRDVAVGANGCLQMTIVCPASPDGGNMYMFFNGGIGGPSSTDSNEVTADVTCSNGNWQYVQDGINTVITEINCLAD